MGYDPTKTDRRTFLSSIGALGLMASLSGCQGNADREADEPSPVTPRTDGLSLGKDRGDSGSGIYNRASRAEALAAYQRIPGLEAQEHTFDVVGTRRMANTWPMVPRSGPTPDTWRYDHDGGQQLIQSIRFGFLEQPPNVVPVFKASPHLESTSTKESFHLGVRLTSQPSDEWLMTFEAAPDSNPHTLYDEVYLHEYPYGSSGRGLSALTEPTVEVHAGIASDPTAGVVLEDSMLALEWEVI